MNPPQPTSSAVDWLSLLFGGLALALGAAVVFALPYLPNIFYIAAIPVAIVVGLFTITHPEWGLLTLIFITYTRASDALVKYQGLPSLADPLIVLLVGVIAFRWLFYKQPPRGWERIATVGLIFGAWCFSSLLYAFDKGTAQYALTVYLKDIVVAIIAATVLQRATSLRAIIWTLLAAGIFLGTLTVIQQVRGDFDNNYSGFAQAAIQNIVGESNDHRAAGSVGDPNFYAQIMIVLVPLALDRLWHEKTLWGRGLALWALGATTLAILFTYSRGGFVALVIAAGMMFVRRRPNLPLMLVTVIVGLSLLQLAPAKYIERISTIFDLIPGLGQTDARAEISFRGRLSENTAAILMFVEHPLTGVGLDNYKIIYTEYSRRLGLDDRLELRAPHSLYLQIASELGVVGLIIFGFVLFILFRGLSRSISDLNKYGLPEAASLIVALQAGIVGYLVAAVFLHSAYARFLWLLLALALTIPHMTRNELQAHRHRETTQRRQATGSLLASPTQSA